MTEYLIGTGGWAYFQVSGLHPLVAYSKAFDFVEVNSTFYKLPNLKLVESWRKLVPSSFKFAVRCNKQLTHKYQFKPTPEAFKIQDNIIAICGLLRAEILHIQTPPRFEATKENAELISNFFASSNMKSIRLALEIRAQRTLSPHLVRTMEAYNMIHCVDLLKGEEPAYKSDILYSRLFGKGPHNIYQPTDDELRNTSKRASRGGHKTVVLSFHGIRMYKDAARLKIYKRTKKFPKVTKSTGLGSLVEVLREDARFPSSKSELITHQGWKLIDLTKTKRVHASYLLERLPEKTYDNISDVVETLASEPATW